MSAIDQIQSSLQPAGGTPTLIHAVNCGGGATGGYEAGAGYLVSGDSFTDGSAIDTSLLTDVPAQAVLQAYSYKNATTEVIYEVSGLNNTPHTVRVFLWDDGGVGTQDITINTVLVQNDIDVGAVAGANYKAIQLDYAVTPSANLINIQIAAATGYCLLPAFEIFED